MQTQRKSYFTQRDFRMKLARIESKLKASTNNQVMIYLNDCTETFSKLAGKESEEFIYSVSVRGSSTSIIIHSTVDRKSDRSTEEAISIRVGLLVSSQTSKMYGELKRIKRVGDITEKLYEAIEYCLKIILNRAEGSLGVNWEKFTNNAITVKELQVKISQKLGKKVEVHAFTGRVVPKSSSISRGIVSHECCIHSVSGEKFVAFTPHRLAIKELLVDTDKRQIIRAVDIDGRDTSKAFVKVVTEKDGLKPLNKTKATQWVYSK